MLGAYVQLLDQQKQFLLRILSSDTKISHEIYQKMLISFQNVTQLMTSANLTDWQSKATNTFCFDSANLTLFAKGNITNMQSSNLITILTNISNQIDQSCTDYNATYLAKNIIIIFLLVVCQMAFVATSAWDFNYQQNHNGTHNLSWVYGQAITFLAQCGFATWGLSSAYLDVSPLETANTAIQISMIATTTLSGILLLGRLILERYQEPIIELATHPSEFISNTLHRITVGMI